jgi:Rad3-related DNA helicase
MWSEIEIEWDLASGSLETTVAALQQLTHYLASAGWQAQEPQATLHDSVRTIVADLGELLLQMNHIILAIAPQGAADTVTWMQIDETSGGRRRRKNERNISLFVAPLHVGQMIEESLVQQRHTAIFTGATLRTGGGFGYIRDRLGLWDATAATVASPFDYKRNVLLYLPDELPLPNQPGHQTAVEEAIIAAALAAGGRTLALFTNYYQLRTTASAIREPLDRAGITVLQHGTSSRNRLLREYRQNPRAVLLGTRTFWEGIDLPGEQLSVLMIVKLPFAVPSDPLVAARSKEFDNPFRDYTLPDAVLRFRQGFGRLIRRATDYGVVVLLDSRVWQKQYGHTFLEALPDCTTQSAPLENLGTEIDLWLNKERNQG